MSVSTESELENHHHHNTQRYDIVINNENKYKNFPKKENLKIYNSYNNKINKEIVLQRPIQNINYNNIKDKPYTHSDSMHKLTPHHSYLNKININNIQNNDQNNQNIIQQDTINELNETSYSSNIITENISKNDQKFINLKEEKKCQCCKDRCNSPACVKIKKICIIIGLIFCLLCICFLYALKGLAP